MFQINYQETNSNTIKHLNRLTDCMKSGFYQIKRIPLSQIDEYTNLKDLLTIRFSTEYDTMVLHDLEIISKMDLISKQILYCVHLLGIKKSNLQSNRGSIEYSFGNPIKDYKNALLKFGLTQEDLIVYMN